ncbi:hypothetical protein JCM10213_009043 [Rhodosporidiobolus nylandii]
MQALLLSPSTRFSPSPDSSGASLSPETPPQPSLDFLDYPPATTPQTPTGAFDTPTQRPRHSTLKGEARDEVETPKTPVWLTDELGEEWVPQGGSPTSPEESRTFLAHEQTEATVVPSSNATPRPPPSSALPPSVFHSLPRSTAPRVPSSLRHAYTASLASSAATDLTGTTTAEGSFVENSLASGGEEGTSVLDFGAATGAEASVFLLKSSLPPSAAYGAAEETFAPSGDSDNDDEGDGGGASLAASIVEREEGDASTGSCVVNSVVERSGGAGNGGTQLRAAVQALRGPAAGLFGEAAGEGMGQSAEEVQVPKKAAGLVGLFAPLSPEGAAAPAPPLPRSTLPSGPTLSTFSFSAPSASASPPRASASPPSPDASHRSPTPPPAANQTSRWKDLMHFSPSPPPKPHAVPSSTPPHTHFPNEYEEATPVPAARAYRTPTAAAATPAAGVGHTGRGKKPALPPLASGAPGRKERFLHRSTNTRPANVPLPPALAPQREQEQETSDGEGEGEDSEDVPFVPPPLPSGEGEGSESMETTSEEEEEGFSPDEEERHAGHTGWAGRPDEGDGEDEGFTSDEEEQQQEVEGEEGHSLMDQSSVQVHDADDFAEEEEGEEGLATSALPPPRQQQQVDLLEPSYLSFTAPPDASVEGSYISHPHSHSHAADGSRSFASASASVADEGEGEGEGELPSRELSGLPSPPRGGLEGAVKSPPSMALAGLSFLSHISEAPEEEEEEGENTSSTSASRSTLAPPLPSPAPHAAYAFPPQQGDSVPLPKSPARIPIPSPLLRPSSSAREARSPSLHPPVALTSASVPAPSAPPSPYKLFQPTYDTLTRSHLLSLVDEIDSLSATAEARSQNLLNGAPEPLRLPAVEEQQEEQQAEGESEEGFLGEEGAARSSKRIKLSPRTEFAERFPSPSPTPSSVTPSRTRRRTPPASSARRPHLRRGSAPFSSSSRPSPATHSPASARTRTPARSARRVLDSSGLPPLPSPMSAADGTIVSTPGSSTASVSVSLAGSVVSSRSRSRAGRAGRAGAKSPPGSSGGSGSERARERKEEAEKVMERIRGLVEKRERRRNGEAVDTTPGQPPSRSPRKRSSPSSSYSPTIDPPTPTQSSDSPPPLPHLAAAASASLRATLSGSPAPPLSPNLGSRFSTTSTSRSVGPPSPALGTAPRLPTGLPAEKAGSIGRRHFARTPLSAKKPSKKDGETRERAKGRGLMGQTKGVRGLFGTAEDDELEAEEADGEHEDDEQEEEEADEVTTFPTTSTRPSTDLSTPSAAASRRAHARQTSLTTLRPSDNQTRRLLATAGQSAREKGLVFDEERQRWIRTPRRVISGGSSGTETVAEASPAPLAAPGAEQEAEEDEEEDPFRDFSELKSNHSIRRSPAAAAAASPAQQQQQQQPQLNLDEIPRAGDGSGSASTRLAGGGADLSGLGITKGTRPLPASPSALAPPPSRPSPASSGGYFSPLPTSFRPAGEGPEGPDLQLESEDSATWGRGSKDKEKEQRRASIRGLFEASSEPLVREKEEKEQGSDALEGEGRSMLDLYRAAHAEQAEDGDEETNSTRSLDTRTLDSRPDSAGPTHRPTSSTPNAGRTLPLPAVSVPGTPAPAPPSGARPAATPLSSARTAPAPPRSAMKQPIRSQSAPEPAAMAMAMATPLRSFAAGEQKAPRSVSFSDGKTSGKIEGLVPVDELAAGYRPSPLRFGAREDDSTTGSFAGGPGELEFDERFGEEADADRTITQESAAVQGSARARRIGSALDELAKGPEDSPFSGRFTRPTSGDFSLSDSATPPRSRRRSFTRTSSAPLSGNSFGPTNGANATFLTECSFGVSHDRLLQYITDVEPFEPDWEGLKSIDLSGKKAESVVRMKEFLPSLDEVNLNNNELTYLTGVPSSLRTLLISSNRLTSLTSFAHLLRLERLDLSNNQLESVHQLACLVHLRELKADGNRIRSLEGLAELDGLVKVSLKGNLLEELDFARTKWSRVETLHLARNQIREVRNVNKLVSLSTLNLDHNLLPSLDPAADMPRLRVLRLCSNPITGLDVSFAPKLRTLYVDSAKLGVVSGTEQLRKLENLSVRDQSGGALTLSMPHIRDVKRLYLSGNPLPSSFPSEKFFNLVYLELAMCQLTSLPFNLATVIPNVRVLNLDYNFLDDLAPLSGLTRLSKLSVVGARLAKARPVANVLSSLVELETVDFRMNPFTLAFYPPLVPSSDGLLPSHSEHRILHPDDLPSSVSPASVSDPSTSSKAWQTLDTKFRRALPDEWYHKRAAYRAVVLQSAPALVRLDGIDCAKERPKLARRLEKLAKKQATASKA